MKTRRNGSMIELEIENIEKNGTWKLMVAPDDKQMLDVKWIVTEKTNGTFKARLEVHGFQEELNREKDFYSPVVKIPTLKTYLSVVCRNKWYIEQHDVQTALLNNPIKSEVYVK